MSDKKFPRSKLRSKEKVRSLTAPELEPYICPTCYRRDGEHTFDCEQSMFGAGISDPEKRERAMLAALTDNIEWEHKDERSIIKPA
jgi:hypothetical protein